MTAYLSTELGQTANQTAAPLGYKPTANAHGARMKRLRGTFTYASQTTSDTLVIGVLPAGATFAGMNITTSVSTGSATLAVGISDTPAKYKAAAAVTTADIPQQFGLAARMADGPLSADETLIVTIAGASLPASGTLVIDVYYSVAS